MINDKRKALGRGLESLLPGRPVPIPQPAAAMPVPNPQGPAEIAIDLIDPNPYQTRRQIREESLNELCSWAMAWITEPAPRNSSALKKAWVNRWNMPA